MISGNRQMKGGIQRNIAADDKREQAQMKGGVQRNIAAVYGNG
jgi:hypothetical protein